MSHGLGIALTVTGVIIAFTALVAYIGRVQHRRDQAAGQPGPAVQPASQPEPQPVPPEWEAIASEITAARRDCKWCQPGVPLSVAMPQDCGCKRDCGVPYCQRRQAVAERGLA